jgi:hypothetical protein
VQLDKLIADSAATPFRLTRHERETVLQLDSVQVQLREGIAQGQVQLTLQDAGTSLRAAWNAHSVPLSVLAPYLPESYHLNGVLNTQGRLEGFLDALHAESTWHLTHLNLNGVALGEATDMQLGYRKLNPASPLKGVGGCKRSSLRSRG